LPTGQEISLKAGTKSKALKDEESPAIVGKGFASEADARNAALQAKRTLLYCMVQNRAGVDLGDGKQRGMATNEGLKMLQEQHGAPFRNDIHGIDVYEFTKNLKFIKVEANAVVGKNADRFSKLFSEEFPAQRVLSAKQILSAELYGSSWFDITPRSRFVTLVTAVEALLSPSSRSAEALEFVEEMQKKMEGLSIDADQKTSLRNSIGMLKTQSISQAGRQLAEKLLGTTEFDGKSAAKFFNHCYNARSKILHEGAPPSGVDIDQLVTPTEEFVSQLLLAHIERCSTPSHVKSPSN
jgi:hypothetical protein